MFYNVTDLKMSCINAASLLFQSVQKYNKTQTLEQIYSPQQIKLNSSKSFIFSFFVLRKYEWR